MKSETPMRIKQSATPIHHFKPRSDADRVLRDSYIHMIAGIVLSTISQTKHSVSEVV
jgi:hypothetical protein